MVKMVIGHDFNIDVIMRSLQVYKDNFRGRIPL